MTFSCPPSTRSSFSLTALAAALALASGCGETVDDALDGGGDGDSPSFADIYAADDFQKCGECHAPGAEGRVAGIEETQNWSSEATAYASLQGNASGLIGNFAGCNGVPLLADSASDSLLVASLDEDVRSNFEVASAPDCTGDAIADQTLHLGGPLPSSLLSDLKAWVNAGAPR